MIFLKQVQGSLQGPTIIFKSEKHKRHFDQMLLQTCYGQNWVTCLTHFLFDTLDFLPQIFFDISIFFDKKFFDTPKKNWTPQLILTQKSFLGKFCLCLFFRVQAR